MHSYTNRWNRVRDTAKGLTLPCSQQQCSTRKYFLSDMHHVLINYGTDCNILCISSSPCSRSIVHLNDVRALLKFRWQFYNHDVRTQRHRQLYTRCNNDRADRVTGFSFSKRSPPPHDIRINIFITNMTFDVHRVFCFVFQVITTNISGTK